METKKGIKILSTRPQSPLPDSLHDELTAAGFDVHHFPTSEIEPVPFNLTTQTIHEIDALIFTSSNGVFYLLNAIEFKLLENKKIFCVGAKTKTYIHSRIPNTHVQHANSAKDLIESCDFTQFSNTLLIQGKIADDYLMNKISSQTTTHKLIVYNTRPANGVTSEIKQNVSQNIYDLVLFTSPSGFSNFTRFFEKNEVQKLPIACIGNTTANSVDEYGASVQLVPDKPHNFAKEITKYLHNQQ